MSANKVTVTERCLYTTRSIIHKGYYPKETTWHLVTVLSSPLSVYSVAENGYNEHIPHSLEGW